MTEQIEQNSNTTESPIRIHLYNEKPLQSPCDPIEVIDDALFDLAGKMLVCMKKNHGVGLSANQVGVNKRFCVVSLEGGKRQMALINPLILSKSKESIKMYEGCLSAPGVFPPIKRAKSIVVQFQNFKGEIVTFEMTDLDARIILHEVDHLNGKMVIDPYRKV